jgi:hypothetical protein
MKRKLTGLAFCLDKRTGAIVAEEDFDVVDASDSTTLLGGKGGYGAMVGEYSLSPLSRTSSFKDKVEPENP